MAKKVNKPIVELDKPNGKTINYFESAKKASDLYKINVVNISYNVNGITKQAKGHYFRFATATEIDFFTQIMQKLDSISQPQPSAEPAPVEDNLGSADGPTPVLPEAPDNNENQTNTTSAFARLLEESKKKFQNNSK